MECPECGEVMERFPYEEEGEVRHYWYCHLCGCKYYEEVKWN